MEISSAVLTQQQRSRLLFRLGASCAHRADLDSLHSGIHGTILPPPGQLDVGDVAGLSGRFGRHTSRRCTDGFFGADDRRLIRRGGGCCSWCRRRRRLRPTHQAQDAEAETQVPTAQAARDPTPPHQGQEEADGPSRPVRTHSLIFLRNEANLETDQGHLPLARLCCSAKQTCSFLSLLTLNDSIVELLLEPRTSGSSSKNSAAFTPFIDRLVPVNESMTSVKFPTKRGKLCQT